MALNCFLGKFLNLISLNLPIETSNVVYRMQISIATGFETPCTRKSSGNLF